MHTPSLSHTHTQIHPWHWIVMSDTKSTVLRCYISPHNTGVNWQYKPLNKACMLLTHTYTELSGLGFLSNCIHRTHTHTHWVIAELLDLSDELDVKIRCSTSWRLVNYITEMCLGNISKTMTEGGWRNTHALWLYSCRGSSKRAAPTPARQRPRTDALTLQLATQPAHRRGDSLSTSDSFHLGFLNAYSYRNHQVCRVKDEQNVDRKLSCETVSKPLTLQIVC